MADGGQLAEPVRFVQKPIATAISQKVHLKGNQPARLPDYAGWVGG